MKKIIYLLLVSLFVFTSCNQEDEILEVTLKGKPVKTTICHYNPHNDTYKTISVNEKQLAKHLEHGDSRAPCGYTYVPDDSFEYALINLGYDDIMDDYVLTSNINTVEELCIGAGGCRPQTRYLCGDFYDCGIQDFTGLEDFTNLKEIFLINQHYFTILDLSKNTALESIMLEENHRHKILIVPESLISLSVGASRDYVGRIKELDLSKCTSLTGLSLGFSVTDFLNLKNGNNKSLGGEFGSINTNCVQVDDVVWSTENWLDYGGMPYTNLSEDCGY